MKLNTKIYRLDRVYSLLCIGVLVLFVILVVIWLDLTFPEFVPLDIPLVSDKIFSLPEPSEEIAVLPAQKNILVKKFLSEEDFKQYLKEAKGVEETGLFGFAMARGRETRGDIAVETASVVSAEKVPLAERISETNVQVLGIDEPDIVKTNGKEIFYSSQHFYPYSVLERQTGIIPPLQKDATKIINAFPPENLALSGKIEAGGNLLIQENILAIFSQNKISGYDISDIASPKEKWKIDLEDNNYIVSSRLYKGKIYTVLEKSIDSYHPCPIKPLSLNGKRLEIPCMDIYYPIQPVPIDTTYTALMINPENGQIERKISFVGYSNSSIIYMSENNLYLTYSHYTDTFPVFADFFIQELNDLLPQELIKKIENLKNYDISSSAKLTEMMILLESYKHSLNNDDRLKLENEIENRGETYFQKHARELEFTTIVKISLDNFNIRATGKVPGRPLNQFSLDEYKKHLRIATTVSGGGFFVETESANDVYVLDDNLAIAGSAIGFGLTERIYSVRFLNERGYVVTFRQIDPFFVLDLSNPQKPELKGQLKIPGYSSYLHPLDKNKILGIGKEGSKVKISLFDVSSSQEPKELSKYLLDEYWSEILNTHHAFLMDSKHKIFFLPGSKGGYVFSYDNDELKMKKAVSLSSPKRALYLNDYLYILSDNKVIVLDENNWVKVKELEF